MSMLFSQFIPPHSRSTCPSPQPAAAMSISLFSTLASLPLCPPEMWSWTQMQLQEVQGRKEKHRALTSWLEDWKGSTREPENARRITKGVQERNCTKLYRTPGLTSKLHMVLTFNNLPNTLGINCSVDQCPDPDWLQGGAQESQTQSALQKAVKTKLTLEPLPSKQAGTCNRNLTC